MNNLDNQRASVAIHANISSQLLAASLVLIGVFLGYLDVKEIPFESTKGILIIISILILLVSIIFSGLGLKHIRDNGEKGDWTLNGLHIFFRTQTRLNYFAIILFFVVFFMKNPVSNKQIYQDKMIELMKKNFEIDSLNSKQNNMQIQALYKINSDLDSISKKVENFQRNTQQGNQKKKGK